MSPLQLLTKEKAQRSLRIIHIAFIAVMLMQLFILFQVRKPAPPLDHTLTIALLAMSLFWAAVVVFLRFNIVPKVDAEAAAMEVFSQKRQTLYIILFAICEAVWLFTWVLSFMGAPLNIAWSGFAVALVLLLLCTPKQV